MKDYEERREELLKKLHKFRADGWEKEACGKYPIWKDEDKTNSQLFHRVWKIQQYRKGIIEERVILTIKFVGLILFILMFVYR